jgi:hypothetical protein
MLGLDWYDLTSGPARVALGIRLPDELRGGFMCMAHRPAHFVYESVVLDISLAVKLPFFASLTSWLPLIALDSSSSARAASFKDSIRSALNSS